MLRAIYANGNDLWAIRKGEEYLKGEALTETGLIPVYVQSREEAKIFRDKDLAEMQVWRYGGELVSMLPVAQAV